MGGAGGWAGRCAEGRLLLVALPLRGDSVVGPPAVTGSHGRCHSGRAGGRQRFVPAGGGKRVGKAEGKEGEI